MIRTIALLFLGLLTACATDPPPRLAAYLGEPALAAQAAPDAQLPDRVSAGLVVINDTTAEGSAPALSTDVLNELVRVFRNRLAREVPGLVLSTELRPADIKPGGDTAAFRDLAKANGLDYLLLAIFSSTEMESPTYLPLTGIPQAGGVGGGGNRPGYEVRSYARLELALLQGGTGGVVLHTDGQAWATLYRLDVSMTSNSYPVILRAMLNNPIYPEEGSAYDVLRGVSSDDATHQAVMHFKERWRERAPLTASASDGPASVRAERARDVPSPGG